MDDHPRRPLRAFPGPRAHITRFGAYATDELGITPEASNPVLAEVDFDLAA